jgi:AraC-like DNA-binding protein
VTGVTLRQYMRHEGRQRAITLVADTDLSFKEIAYRLGFRSQGNFSTAFRDVSAKLPENTDSAGTSVLNH